MTLLVTIRDCAESRDANNSICNTNWLEDRIAERVPNMAQAAKAGGRNNMGPISVALVDDHPLMLAGVVNLFETHKEFAVVAKGATADDALQINRQFRPDVM